MTTKTFEPGAYAAAANALIASITPVLQSMSFPDGVRVHPALNLVKSSIDLGYAATGLIATDNSYNGLAALVLVRPQLEHLFRGILHRNSPRCFTQFYRKVYGR